MKIGKKLIKSAKFVKFLGLLLDEHLSWKYHLSELSKKLARTCGVFLKISNLLPLDVFFVCSILYFYPSYNMVLLFGVKLLRHT